MSILVLIVNRYTRNSDENIKRLRHLFSASYFDTQVVGSEEANENQLIISLLKYAREGPYKDQVPQYTWTGLPVLLIMDNSVSLLHPADIKDYLTQGIAQLDRHRADLLYLTTWNDKCNKYTTVAPETPYLRWTIQPSATQAVLYPPRTRDRLVDKLKENPSVNLQRYISEELRSGHLEAMAFVPNILAYDVSLATNTTDYQRANACQYSDPDPVNSNLGPIIWFILIVIIAIGIGYLLLQYFG